MKPGETIMIYSSPHKCEQPEGLAKLIRFVNNIYLCRSDNFGELELWDVEFEDSPGNIYPRLIKKT